MNKLKGAGLGLVAAGGLTQDQWLLILSIVITVLGMIQEYMKENKK